MRGKALDNGTEGDVVNVMNLQSKRTLSGTVIGRGQVSISPASITPSAPARRPAMPPPRSAQHNPRPLRSLPSVRQSLQKPSNVNVSHPSQPHHSHGRHAVAGRLGQRLFLDRPSVADRRKAEADGDRKPDHAARLQAGADADAEAGAGFLQRQLAVAERLSRLLQGSARGADRRSADGDRQHHRQGQHRQRDPAQPHQQGRLRHHRFHRLPDDHAGRTRSCQVAS